VVAVFLLAYVDLSATQRRVPMRAVAKALRRVRADVVVVSHCGTGSGNRLRRDARYDLVWTQPGSPGAVALDTVVLSNGPVTTRTCDLDGVVMCDVQVGGGRTDLASVGEPPSDLFRLLVHLDESRPLVVMGCLDDDPDSPETRARVREAGYVDATLNGPEVPEGVRHVRIVVTGLRNYGDNVYVSPEGARVHWARLGY
jgi:hypothetical protein